MHVRHSRSIFGWQNCGTGTTKQWLIQANGERHKRKRSRSGAVHSIKGCVLFFLCSDELLLVGHDGKGSPQSHQRTLDASRHVSTCHTHNPNNTQPRPTTTANVHTARRWCGCSRAYATKPETQRCSISPHHRSFSTFLLTAYIHSFLHTHIPSCLVISVIVWQVEVVYSIASVVIAYLFLFFYYFVMFVTYCTIESQRFCLFCTYLTCLGSACCTVSWSEHPCFQLLQWEQVHCCCEGIQTPLSWVGVPLQVD